MDFFDKSFNYMTNYTTSIKIMCKPPCGKTEGMMCRVYIMLNKMFEVYV